MSKHEDPFLNYFFVPFYVTDTKCSFMRMTLVSAMTSGNNFHFIPYFRGVLSTNVGMPQLDFGLLALCQKQTNKQKPNQQKQHKKWKTFCLGFLQCCLGWQKTPGFSQSLDSFFIMEEFYFFSSEYGHARTWGLKPSLFSAVSSVDTVKYLTVTIPAVR